MNNSGGLKHRKIEPKIVEHSENKNNPERCFVRFYQIYVSHCSPASKHTSDLFYLTPLKKKNDIMVFWCAIGHNTLGKTVSRSCTMSGIKGFKTNHSLRVTAATRLFHAGVDEQLIIKRTGHL